MSRPVVVTTSWDDGDCADLKLAELLQSKGIRGTFYIPINYRERSLDHSALRSLVSEGFEIGAHGCSHKPLWGLQPQELAEEVRPCKRMLEDILAKEVDMFCYPRGRYDSNAIRALRQAGYKGARTARMLVTTPASNPFEIATTLQVFPHLPSTYLKNVVRAHSLETLQACLVQFTRLGNWLELGKRLFDKVLEKGGIWHLCGHSWEIQKLDLWDDLDNLLDYVCRRDGVAYVPNSAMVGPLPGAPLTHTKHPLSFAD